MIGKVHSIESLGTVDGPGIRLVVFLQGCPMRCLYCHNPDTWSTEGGKLMRSEEILAEFDRNKHYYQKGGITVTGGEPLLQIDFLTDLCKKAKAQGIHTCIDTSGATFNHKAKMQPAFDQLFSYVDLVLLDIKQINPQAHLELTGMDNQAIIAFVKYLEAKKIPVWIRHVLVPKYTDNKKDLYNLGHFLGGLSNIQALEILPYHTMGLEKYSELALDYPLKYIEEPSSIALEKAKKTILNGIKLGHLQKKE